MLWVLNLSDGRKKLLDIAERSGVAFDLIRETVEALLGSELMKERS
jgi:aminopeptidase-like protein